MKQSEAENIAIDALAWLADDPELVGGFLGVSGADVSQLQSAASNPEFLGFVLDYIMMDDSLVLACANTIGVKPEVLAAARHYLPGGEVPEWT